MILEVKMDQDEDEDIPDLFRLTVADSWWLLLVGSSGDLVIFPLAWGGWNGILDEQDAFLAGCCGFLGFETAD